MMERNTGEGSLDSVSEPSGTNPVNTNVDVTEPDVGPIPDTELQNDGEHVPDPDHVLRDCFLRGTKLVKDTQLPMPVNVFYAQYMVAQKSLAEFNIRKTSYKKVGTFLKAMAEDGLILLDEPKPGVMFLKSIMRDHLALRGINVTVDCLDESLNSTTGTSSSNWPVGYAGPPVIEDVRIISGPVSALFTLAGYSPNSCISQSEAHKAISQYVRENRLQRLEDPGLVCLDALLMKFCNPNTYIEAPESTLAHPVYLISFAKLISAALQQLSVAYRITPPPGHGEPTLWRKRDPPFIQLSTATKNGKKVTRVANLPHLLIDPTAFAQRLQVTLACSVCHVDEPQFASLSMIQAQGSHEAAISKILTETYRIPKRFIKGFVECSKPKKKLKV